MPQKRTYIAIDLKSFYASVECVERHLNPLTTNLVVADRSRTEKTICLAVSPSLKAFGISGRARLFEVIHRVAKVNRSRLDNAIRQKTAVRDPAGNYQFASSSFDADALAKDSSLKLSYLTATPRMQMYMDYSAKIYHIYLKYIAPEDIHVYSIDEVFMDVTGYLSTYGMSARELAMSIIREVLYSTGITATAGIGPNLYLCKVAMDIVAKKAPVDKNGVRIAELDEMSYRRLLWNHRPLTDFWRVGHGYAGKLEAAGLFTMGDIARCSLGGPYDYYNEDLLYKLFGVNAELLIDHAWGWEPVTLDHIRQYKPRDNSLGSGQVLQHPYNAQKGKLIVKEMTELLVLDLVAKGLVTNQMTLTIGYDKESLSGKHTATYRGPIKTDRYGRRIPGHAHGTIGLKDYTSSTRLITNAVTRLFDRIINPKLLIRRVTITACHVIQEQDMKDTPHYEQLELFTDYAALEKQRIEQVKILKRERQLQKAILSLQKKYGKNAVLKGMNLEDGATTIERNHQIGGHKA